MRSFGVSIRLVTPQGIAEKTRLTYEFMDYSLHLYRDVRQHLTEALRPCRDDGAKRIAKSLFALWEPGMTGDAGEGLLTNSYPFEWRLSHLRDAALTTPRSASASLQTRSLWL